MSNTLSYPARVADWVDGDTADVSLDLGFDLSLRRRVRLFGVNAPEVHSTHPEEKAAGLAAKAFSESLAPPGSAVVVRTEKDGIEKYGRLLADLVLPDGRSVSDVLIANGHGKPYFGGHRDPA